MNSYSVTISKDGKARTFSFNTEDKANRFAAKSRNEGFDTMQSVRNTADLLREMFPEKFVA